MRTPASHESRTNGAEVERLKRVYAKYRRTPAILGRWRDNEGARAILAERQNAMLRLLQNHGLFPFQNIKILEIGCGSGSELNRFVAWGAPTSNLYGVDLLPERVADAKARSPELRISCCNAEQLPFADESFDIVLMYVLMSSVLNPEMRRNIASEATRVLRSGGAIAWYDLRYDNPYNRHVRGIGADAVKALFPSLSPDLTTVTVLPPLARRLGRFADTVYPLLRRVPVFRTHITGLLLKA